MDVKMFAYLTLMVSVVFLMETGLASGNPEQFHPEKLAESFAELDEKIMYEKSKKKFSIFGGLNRESYRDFKKVVEKIKHDSTNLEHVANLLLGLNFDKPRCDFWGYWDLNYIYHGVFANEFTDAPFLKRFLKPMIEKYLETCDQKTYEFPPYHKMNSISVRFGFNVDLIKSKDLDYSNYELLSPMTNEDSLRIMSERIIEQNEAASRLGFRRKKEDIQGFYDEYNGCDHIINYYARSIEIHSNLAKMSKEGTEIDFVRSKSDEYKLMLYHIQYCRALVKDGDKIEELLKSRKEDSS